VTAKSLSGKPLTLQKGTYEFFRVLFMQRPLERKGLSTVTKSQFGAALALLRHAETLELNKETRPIGMPTIEDKVLQRAVVMLLEPKGRGLRGGLQR
jgi:hypothetical protein